MSNFDRFSERTRSVLAYAHEEARSLGQQPINTGHLLLSLLDEPNGVIPRVLQPLKVSVLALRDAVQAVVEFGNAELEGDGLSREAQQALRLAIEESQRLGRDLVEPEHVLLGLIGQDDGIAARQVQLIPVLGVMAVKAPAVLLVVAQHDVVVHVDQRPLRAVRRHVRVVTRRARKNPVAEGRRRQGLAALSPDQADATRRWHRYQWPVAH